MQTCNARYLESELVFCQLEAGHTGEHFSRYRNEDDPEDWVGGKLWWKNAEDLICEN